MNVNEQIKNELLKAIDAYFFVNELYKLSSSFIKYKCEEGFPIGNLTKIHYHMFGGDSPDILKVSAAMESLILALDIFDDFQDNDQPNLVWNMVPKEESLNIAIGLLSLSHRLIEETSFDCRRKRKAIAYLSDRTLVSVNGQHIDLQNKVVTAEDYFHMVKNKSGALSACACMLGTLLATDNPPSLVEEYASLIGIIAQMENDCQDILRLDEKNDIIAKRKTLPILYLLRIDNDEYQLFRDYYAGLITKEELLEEKEKVKHLISSSGALQYTKIHIRLYQKRLKELIFQLSVDDMYKKQLINLFLND